MSHNHRRKQEAGSVARVPAMEIERRGTEAAHVALFCDHQRSSAPQNGHRSASGISIALGARDRAAAAQRHRFALRLRHRSGDRGFVRRAVDDRRRLGRKPGRNQALLSAAAHVSTWSTASAKRIRSSSNPVCEGGNAMPQHRRARECDQSALSHSLRREAPAVNQNNVRQAVAPRSCSTRSAPLSRTQKIRSGPPLA
jgi:hypothetical protein